MADVPVVGMHAGFFCYDAKNLAIDKRRPWQVCTTLGCVVAKLKTKEEAEMAVIALETDKAAGTLPCDLSLWSQRHLLDPDDDSHSYEIQYRCPDCHHAWIERYSCACDSKCPRCGVESISPVEYKEIQ